MVFTTRERILCRSLHSLEEACTGETRRRTKRDPGDTEDRAARAVRADYKIVGYDTYMTPDDGFASQAST